MTFRTILSVMYHPKAIKYRMILQNFIKVYNQYSKNYNVGICPTSWPPLEYRWRPLFKMMRSKSSITPLLVPRCKVWLTPTARVPCSNAANIGQCDTWMQSEFCTWQNSVRGATAPKMYIYIVYQHRRRPNIVRSLVDLQ